MAASRSGSFRLKSRLKRDHPQGVHTCSRSIDPAMIQRSCGRRSVGINRRRRPQARVSARVPVLRGPDSRHGYGSREAAPPRRRRLMRKRQTLCGAPGWEPPFSWRWFMGSIAASSPSAERPLDLLRSHLQQFIKNEGGQRRGERRGEREDAPL